METKNTGKGTTLTEEEIAAAAQGNELDQEPDSKDENKNEEQPVAAAPKVLRPAAPPQRTAAKTDLTKADKSNAVTAGGQTADKIVEIFANIELPSREEWEKNPDLAPFAKEDVPVEIFVPAAEGRDADLLTVYPTHFLAYNQERPESNLNLVAKGITRSKRVVAALVMVTDDGRTIELVASNIGAIPTSNKTNTTGQAADTSGESSERVVIDVIGNSAKDVTCEGDTVLTVDLALLAGTDTKHPMHEWGKETLQKSKGMTNSLITFGKNGLPSIAPYNQGKPMGVSYGSAMQAGMTIKSIPRAYQVAAAQISARNLAIAATKVQPKSGGVGATGDLKAAAAATMANALTAGQEPVPVEQGGGLD